VLVCIRNNLLGFFAFLLCRLGLRFEALVVTEFNEMFSGRQSGCEGLPTFRELNPSPFSGRASGLVAVCLFLYDSFNVSVTQNYSNHTEFSRL
jgi:hypothetical protein